MKPAVAAGPVPAGAGADQVGEAGVGVDVQVVGVADRLQQGARVHLRRGDVRRHAARVDVAQLGEVVDLHAVVVVLGDDVGVVGVHLDVTPERATGGRRGVEERDVDGVSRV